MEVITKIPEANIKNNQADIIDDSQIENKSKMIEEETKQEGVDKGKEVVIVEEVAKVEEVVESEKDRKKREEEEKRANDISNLILLKV